MATQFGAYPPIDYTGTVITHAIEAAWPNHHPDDKAEFQRVANLELHVIKNAIFAHLEYCMEQASAAIDQLYQPFVLYDAKENLQKIDEANAVRSAILGGETDREALAKRIYLGLIEPVRQPLRKHLILITSKRAAFRQAVTSLEELVCVLRGDVESPALGELMESDVFLDFPMPPAPTDKTSN
ncbi:MAG: hypothetical protein HKM24_03870 [Gammaproteobacteria bacterium]|nr:hypothetical protein [Gammaproteobacteria bacterium]